MRTLVVAHLLLLPVATGACGGNSTTAPTTATSPTTVTWTTFVGPGGTASRSFTTTAAGAVSVTLQAAGLPLGIGLGIPRASGNGCRLAVSMTAEAGAAPQLTAPVDGGEYCVEVFDIGGITEPISFTLQLVHP
jgi:hypothetical protein